MEEDEEWEAAECREASAIVEEAEEVEAWASGRVASDRIKTMATSDRVRAIRATTMVATETAAEAAAVGHKRRKRQILTISKQSLSFWPFAEQAAELAVSDQPVLVLIDYPDEI